MIIKLEESFLKELNKNYNYNGYTQILEGNRFHLCTIIIDSTPFIICIPLHSNCRRNFIKIIPPDTSKHWKNHGLDYGKMILTKTQDLEKYATQSGVRNNVWEDILLKKEHIILHVKEYILNIISYMIKKEEGLYLAKFEKNDLNYSTLNCFPNYVKELREYDIFNLDFKFKVFPSINSLINYMEK